MGGLAGRALPGGAGWTAQPALRRAGAGAGVPQGQRVLCAGVPQGWGECGAPGAVAPGCGCPEPGCGEPPDRAPACAAPGLCAPACAAPGLCAPACAAPGLCGPACAAPGLCGPERTSAGSTCGMRGPRWAACGPGPPAPAPEPGRAHAPEGSAPGPALDGGPAGGMARRELRDGAGAPPCPAVQPPGDPAVAALDGGVAWRRSLRPPGDREPASRAGETRAAAPDGEAAALAAATHLAARLPARSCCAGAGEGAARDPGQTGLPVGARGSRAPVAPGGTSPPRSRRGSPVPVIEASGAICTTHLPARRGSRG
jgi:hypothetical protein